MLIVQEYGIDCFSVVAILFFDSAAAQNQKSLQKVNAHSRFFLLERKKENNTRDSNVVPHRSTNRARACLTSLSRREAVLSCWYGRSQQSKKFNNHILLTYVRFDIWISWCESLSLSDRA